MVANQNQVDRITSSQIVTPHIYFKIHCRLVKSNIAYLTISGKPKNKMLDAVSSDSRRGSLVPPGSRRGSRQGSISLAGTERRGSYYGDDVSKRATVAVVVDGDKGKMNGEGKIIPISIIQTIFTIKNFTSKLERLSTQYFRWCY